MANASTRLRDILDAGMGSNLIAKRVFNCLKETKQHEDVKLISVFPSEVQNAIQLEVLRRKFIVIVKEVH